MPEKEILKSLDDNACDHSSDSLTSELSQNSLSLQNPPNSEITTVTTTGHNLQQTSSDIIINEHLINDLNNSSSDSSNISNTLMSDNSSTAPSNLAGFLIQRACKNPTLANYFYWYLSIECEDQETIRKQDERVREMYVTVLKTFLRTLSIGKLLFIFFFL